MESVICARYHLPLIAEPTKLFSKNHASAFCSDFVSEAVFKGGKTGQGVRKIEVTEVKCQTCGKKHLYS